MLQAKCYFASSPVNMCNFKAISSSNYPIVLSQTSFNLFGYFNSTLLLHIHEVFPCLFLRGQRHLVWLNKCKLQLTAQLCLIINRIYPSPMSASIRMVQSCLEKPQTKKKQQNTYHHKTVTSLHRSTSSDNFLQATYTVLRLWKGRQW